MVGERIIPITILSSNHEQNDENDNTATVSPKNSNLPMKFF